MDWLEFGTDVWPQGVIEVARTGFTFIFPFFDITRQFWRAFCFQSFSVFGLWLIISKKTKLKEIPVENLEHEGLAKNPNLELAQLKFFLTLDQHKNDATAKKQLMDAIRADGKI